MYFKIPMHNIIHKNLRDVRSVETKNFKFELDKFLEMVPDDPKMENYATTAISNRILLYSYVIVGFKQCTTGMKSVSAV